MTSDKKLLIVVNEDKFFLSHRKDIGLAAKDKGWEVVIVAKNTGDRAKIEDMGLKFIEMPVNPTGKKLHQELKTLLFLYKFYGKNKDAVVHHVGLKNISWGGVAARLRGIDGVIDAISGLGIFFSDYHESRLKKLLVPVLRWGMNHHNVNLIFQNNDDRRLFYDNNIGQETDKIFIKGSGVNLDEFDLTKRETKRGKIRVIFAGRMVRDKGVTDLIEAAEMLRPEYEDKVEFVLCGALTSNPYGVSKEELDRLCDGKYISWLGYRNDMADQFSSSDIMCFPSYYREGVPKAVIDASAAGLPVITCDSVGCRDTVEDGVNGFLVPPRSPEKIAEKLKILIDDEDLRKKMGRESRRMAEKDYDIKNVVERHLELYDEVLKKKKNSRK